MTPHDALECHAALQQAYGELLVAVAADDPDPQAIAAINARIATLADGLERTVPTVDTREVLRLAADETIRLAQAAAGAAQERRAALTAEQAQAESQRGALDAYHAGSSRAADDAGAGARFIDRHS